MSERKTVLVVDDDRNTREGLKLSLEARFDVRLAADAAMAKDELADGNVDIMLSDIRMPGGSGMDLLKYVQANHQNVICILLTAYGDVPTAVEAMRNGASDFLSKPVDLDHLDIVIDRALETRSLRRRNAELERQLDDRSGLEGMIGDAPAMKGVFEMVRTAAPTLANVLVTGPSGTGKELVAHAIHRLSGRSRGPFVAVNCAALSPTLLESELFGHEKGAFTGADSQRKGRFELAAGGTLFLDEIGEIDMATQVKLLRVLEERKFERVGGTAQVAADFRLVAATNKDLLQLVADGKFRNDLYYRLNVVNIRIPPLSERNGDIPKMCATFIREFARRDGRNVTGITGEAVNVLSAYSWPGNVRELRNTIERMVVLARGERLTVSDIPPDITAALSPANRPSAGASLLSGSLAESEKSKILAVLEKHNGNKTAAALELGIARRTLHRKLSEWGMVPKRV